MGSKKESVPLLKGSEAEDLVKEYLKEQYRPYSVSDLVLNLHNKINKPTMTKCLESLVSKNEIISKTYGKMAYYVYKEELSEDLPLEINVEAIEKLKEELEELTQSIKLLQGEYLKLVEQPTNEEAARKIPELEVEASQLESKLSLIKQEGNSRLSKQEIDKHKCYTKDLEQIFRQRKKLFNNFLNMIKEGVEDYPHVISEIGIDMDQVEDLSTFCV